MSCHMDTTPFLENPNIIGYVNEIKQLTCENLAHGQPSPELNEPKAKSVRFSARRPRGLGLHRLALYEFCVVFKLIFYFFNFSKFSKNTSACELAELDPTGPGLAFGPFSLITTQVTEKFIYFPLYKTNFQFTM